ncbi:ABC transporter ATP-binding protein [Desulfuromonas sp. TF]|uniref:ABC transporter ATP-binding protein n=1 Tax=Desulfuromonas sp. TF TaxID=1232410 RepID=UPI0003FA5431|nr:ABC transporter ATP-binding protein [Desulfuromonas sp. TF]
MKETASNPIIEAREIHTYYGDSHILHGINFNVSAGETVSLMGRNGMGKTTLLRSLLGLTPPRRGTVKVFGRDMTGAPPQKIVRQGIAFVPEDRGIFPKLTVRENLVMAARQGPNGRREWDLDRVLDTFPRLAQRMTNMGNHLSGGEQQMLTVGRALMTNPDLILLDEATEGLAPLIRNEIWSVVRQIKESGIASVIVDKDLKALLGVSDRNIIISKGRIVFEGSSEELASNPEIHKQHLGV